jgi:hypothetical protein
MTHDGSFNQRDITHETGQAFRLVRMIQRGFMWQMNRCRVASALIGELTFMDTKVHPSFHS